MPPFFTTFSLRLQRRVLLLNFNFVISSSLYKYVQSFLFWISASIQSSLFPVFRHFHPTSYFSFLYYFIHTFLPLHFFPFFSVFLHFLFLFPLLLCTSVLSDASPFLLLYFLSLDLKFSSPLDFPRFTLIHSKTFRYLLPAVFLISPP